jgi:2-dehydropantoate 2-reductase
MDRLTVAIFGSGGTGGFYGGALARKGHAVKLIARGPHLAAMKKSGLQVKSVLLGDFNLDVTATDNPAEIGPVDLVVFAVKSWGTEAAIKSMAPLVGPDTMIISTQNGIDSERQLAEAFRPQNVLGCTVTVSAKIESPGVVVQVGGPGAVVLGEMSGGLSDRVTRLAGFFSEAGLPVEASENVQRAIWMKFIFICALSGMTALTRKPIGEIFAQKISTEMYLQVLEEVTAVGRAEGVDLPPDTAAKILKSTQAREPFIIGSMGHDLIAGNPIEISLLNGRVAELGKKHGIPTPANFAITAALKPHERGR